MKKQQTYSTLSKVMTCIFAVLSILWLVPIFEVL